MVEVLAPFLVARGHAVTVYCDAAKSIPADCWQGVNRIFIPRRLEGSAGTLIYDLASFMRVPVGSVALLFGYGSALFQPILKLRGIPHAVNMDGIEWQRAKWGRAARLWLRANEKIAAMLADILIADHPEIAASISSRFKRTAEMITYGVTLQPDLAASEPTHPLLDRYRTGQFHLIIARPEPENQCRLLLEAWHASGAARPMLVIGKFDSTDYGRSLIVDFPQVHFAGPVYDVHVLNVLRRRAVTYLHGHSVGGTNPSLIEAMAAGGLVVAHDNPFNRWVLGAGGPYFRDVPSLASILAAPPTGQQRMAYLEAARARCEADFLWPRVLAEYGQVIDRLATRLEAAVT